VTLEVEGENIFMAFPIDWYDPEATSQTIMKTDSSRSGPVTGRDPGEFDWRERDRTPTECIIDAIAAETGVPPTDQRPLYESVDPDALDGLLESAIDTPERGPPLTVSFCHEHCEVHITAGGELSVTQQAVEQ